MLRMLSTNEQLKLAAVIQTLYALKRITVKWKEETDIVCLYSFFLIESVKHNKNTCLLFICLNCFRGYSKLNLCSLKYAVIAVRKLQQTVPYGAVVFWEAYELSETVFARLGKTYVIIQMQYCTEPGSFPGSIPSMKRMVHRKVLGKLLKWLIFFFIRIFAGIFFLFNRKQLVHVYSETSIYHSWIIRFPGSRSISIVPERILFQLWLPHLLFSRIHYFFFRPPTKTMNRGFTVLDWYRTLMDIWAQKILYSLKYCILFFSF
jgi:hypothetical protein